MKRFRIFITTLLMMIPGTVCAFAESATETAKKEPPWEIIVIVVVVALIAYNEIKRARERRNDRDDADRGKKKW